MRPGGDGRSNGGAGNGFEHVVQFYEDEDLISGAVADFFVTGLSGSEPVVLITTPARRAAVERRLAAQGIDLAAVAAERRVVFSDARQTLEAFMNEGEPDADRFNTAMHAVLERCTPDGGRIRVFGDMVDLLSQDGNTDGAIRLEALWHELARTRDFTLFCAYHMGNFYREVNGRAYREICARHSRVIPVPHLPD